MSDKTDDERCAAGIIHRASRMEDITGYGAGVCTIT